MLDGHRRHRHGVSRYHVVAECGGQHPLLRVDRRAVVDRDGLRPPGDIARTSIRRLAFRGDVVYVAFSRIAPDGGCSGSRGVDVGVYFRTKTQPDGAWSAPVRLGSGPDSLRSFRVDGDTIHAIVRKGGDRTGCTTRRSAGPRSTAI